MHAQVNKSFTKQYKKLPYKIREQFKSRRDLLLATPIHPLLDNHPLHPPFVGSRSINVTGDYRAIFIQKDPDTILFTDIGTHHQLFGT